VPEEGAQGAVRIGVVVKALLHHNDLPTELRGRRPGLIRRDQGHRSRDDLLGLQIAPGNGDAAHASRLILGHAEEQSAIGAVKARCPQREGLPLDLPAVGHERVGDIVGSPGLALIPQHPRPKRDQGASVLERPFAGDCLLGGMGRGGCWAPDAEALAHCP